MNVYRVKFKELWDNEKSGGRNELQVAAQDGETAIEKAKKHVLKQKFRDDENPKVTHQCTGFVLLELDLVSEIDL